MKLSAFLGAVGVGLCVACAAGALATLNAWGWPPHVFVLLFFCFGGAALAVDGGLAMVVGWRQAHVEIEARRQDNKRAAVNTARLAWDLKVTQREAAVASGLAGAREAEALERRWQAALAILFRAIDKAGGASGRKLAGVVGSDAHPALMAFYTSPAGLCILRDAGSNVGHTWGYKDDGELWGLDDVLALIRAGKLPHPDGEPPEINPLPPSAAQRNRAKRSATVVIDQ